MAHRARLPERRSGRDRRRATRCACCLGSNGHHRPGDVEPNRTSLFTFPLLVATFQLTNQFLWAAPVVAGLGGALLSAHPAVRTGFALIWIGIAVELLATAQNIANWGFDAGALLSPISGRSILALPFCVALGVASMNLRSRAGVRADLLPL